ncbi:MAG TPA: histidine kinase dimerization/phospho-acceptor domain-containing protein, partial [Candidatus Dormibacteraeota bacterium]|nr:histidine kinase dimerization/phospho-acceptor domain-containing protein [Candidatus Dormibacteraeota bacterium]
MSVWGLASQPGQRDRARRSAWRDSLSLPGALILWTGSGLAVVLLLVLLPARLVLPWVVPATSGATVVSFVLVAWLAALDVRLRMDSASLPAVTIGAVLSIAWLAHLLTLPGLRPAVSAEAASDARAWLYLSINLATPSLLALAALHVPRPTIDGGRAVRAAAKLGLVLGLGLVALGVLLGLSDIDTIRIGAALPTAHLVGVLGLVPVGAAATLLLRGHRGDERVLRGVVPALVLSGANSLVLLWVDRSYTPTWYASYVLATAIAVCLLYGQLNLFARAVQAELRASARLRDSFATAEALASSLRPEVVINELLERSTVAVEADRASLCVVRGDSVVIQGSRSRDIPPLAAGYSFPLASIPSIEAAIGTRRIQIAVAPVGRPGQAAALAKRIESTRHALVVPLALSGELVGILAFGRVGDVPFGNEDLAAVGTIATVAALALHNAQQFASVEEVSDAKTLFLNLVAHELRTPLSVVRGYASMLRDGTLGELPNGSADAVTALQSKSGELTHLVEGLLMASRLEAGRLRPRRRELDLRMVVTEAVARLRPSVELRGARVDVDLPAGRLPVRADPDYLGRILDNLLVNGITYSKGRP